jgi:DNA-binding winged helix-turn-helix (wHTH) protein
MIFAFDEYTLDLRTFELRSDGRPVPIQRLSTDLLIHLLRNRDRLVSKVELIAEVWNGTVVGEAAVAQAIAVLRRVLKDQGRSHRLIETVRGRGYRFVGDVREQTAPGELELPGGEPVRIEPLRSRLTELCADANAGRGGVASGTETAEIERRLRDLSSECRELLAAASVLGRELELPVLASMTDRDVPQVLEHCGEAAAAGLLAQRSAIRYQFVDDSIRDVLYERLAHTRRADLHARAGAAIESVCRDPTNRLRELALHFYLGSPVGGAARSLDYSERAGHSAMRDLAFEEAAQHFERALEMVAMAGAGDELRLRLLLATGRALSSCGDYESAAVTFRKAMDLARTVGDAVSFGLAAEGLGRGPRTDVPERAVIAALEEAVVRHAGNDPRPGAHRTDAAQSRLAPRILSHRLSTTTWVEFRGS